MSVARFDLRPARFLPSRGGRRVVRRRPRYALKTPVGATKQGVSLFLPAPHGRAGVEATR